MTPLRAAASAAVLAVLGTLLIGGPAQADDDVPAQVPAITSISPASGSTDGGDIVTLTGHGLNQFGFVSVDGQKVNVATGNGDGDVLEIAMASHKAGTVMIALQSRDDNDALTAQLTVPYTYVQASSAPSPLPSSASPLAVPATPKSVGWLAEINKYRKASGLHAVTASAAAEAGSVAHSKYLVKTPKKYKSGKYVSAHSENPASPFHTDAGQKAGAAGNVLQGGAASQTGAQDIDEWLSAPFHSIGILMPSLRTVGLGVYGDDATLKLASHTPTPPRQIVFPANGMTTNLTRFSGNENPNPLQTCGWKSGGGYGLPVYALLTKKPTKRLSATLTDSAGTFSTKNKTLCVVDANTYKTTDKVYGPAGAATLREENAVILIPRHPLQMGAHRVTITQTARRAVTWSFKVAKSTSKLGQPGQPAQVVGTIFTDGYFDDAHLDIQASASYAWKADTAPPAYVTVDGVRIGGTWTSEYADNSLDTTITVSPGPHTVCTVATDLNGHDIPVACRTSATG